MSDISMLKQISGRLKTSSAVVPSLLAALICMPIGAAGLAFGNEKNAILFAICLLSPLFVLLGQIILFTAVDRDRLHNEEHIERRMIINQSRAVIGDNGRGEEIILGNDRLIGSNDQESL